MQTLTQLDWEILNATADDWENLEQIYRSICFDFSAELYEHAKEGAFYLRPASKAPLLETLADRIVELVQAGLLEGHLDDQPVVDQSDLRFVWRAWFRMSPEGRRTWSESEHASVV